MLDNFEKWWRFLIFWEKEYAGNIGDGAGITIYGFTEKYHPELVKQLKELYFSGKKDVAETIAKTQAKTLYWDVLTCDLLPSKLDVVIADTCFNQGVSVAKNVLRKSAQDSLILFGKELAEKYGWVLAIIKRSDYYDDLRSWDKFGRGWNKRIISLYDYLLTDFKILHYD
jgi:lysozyme family protein